MMRRRRVSIEVVGEGDSRYVVETFDNGETKQRLVETDAKPGRRPRKPFVRAWKKARSEPED
jgi:hypothetical protein